MAPHPQPDRHKDELSGEADPPPPTPLQRSFLDGTLNLFPVLGKEDEIRDGDREGGIELLLSAAQPTPLVGSQAASEGIRPVTPDGTDDNSLRETR